MYFSPAIRSAMVTSTKRGKQQSSHSGTCSLHGSMASEQHGRLETLALGSGDGESCVEMHRPARQRKLICRYQASVHRFPFVLSRTSLHLVERKNGSLAEPRIAASGAANGRRGALGGGFRYRHGTQSAAPGPARHCPIGLERRGILFVKAAPGGIATPAPRATPSPMRHGLTGTQGFFASFLRRTWTPAEGIGDLQGQSPPGSWLSPAIAGLSYSSWIWPNGGL